MRVIRTDRKTLWTTPFCLTMLGMLFLFIPFSLYMPVLPAYLLEELNSSLQAAGAVNAAFLIAAVLFRVHTPRLEARFGVRRVLLASGIVFTATNAIYLGLDSVAGILLNRFVSGAAFAIVNTSTMALGSRLVPRSRIGEGLAYLTTMVLAGGAVGPYIGLKLSSVYGYPSVFVFSTLTTLLGLLIICLVPDREEIAKTPARISVRDLFEVKAVPVSLIILVLAFSYGGVMTFVVVYAAELHLPLVIEYFFVVMATASVLSRLATGRLYDRLGADAAICVSIVILAGGLMILGGIHITAWMLLAAAMIGVGYGSAVPSMQALAIQISPEHRSSAVTATFFTCVDGGIGLGAYVLGGGIQAFGYAAVYLALGVMSFGCLLSYYLLSTANRRSQSGPLPPRSPEPGRE
jgi:MFS family permease